MGGSLNHKDTSMIRIITIFGVILTVLLMPFGFEKGLNASQINKTVLLTVGKAETLTLNNDMADVLVADPSIVDIGALKANQLYAVGLKTGATNVLVFDKNGAQIMNYNISVAVDNTTLQATLNNLVPGQDIRVTTVNNDIVLSGTVDTPIMASRARDIAGRFTSNDEGIVNLLSVKTEQQVMLKVKIVEAGKATLKELGIENNLTLGDSFGNFAGSAIGATADTGLTATPFGTGTLAYSTTGFGALNLLLKALEQKNLVNTLAEPNLTAISGEQAGFLVGGEFPIPSGRDQFGNILIEYKKFGVSLNFKPIVMSDDRISMQLTTEVSAPTTNNSVTIASVNVPSLNVRRAETTVELNSGGSLMIAGLLQSQTVSALNQLPGADKAPVLGDLIKSQSFSRDESELLVMVTAYLVKPYAEKDEAVRAEPTIDQEVTVDRAMDTDLQSRLRKIYGEKYDRALTAVPEGASYVFN